MAWHLVSKLKQFIMTMNDTDIELNNFDSCLPFSTEADIILSNPIPNMEKYESYGYSDRDNPSLYAAAYSSLVPGTLNFFSYYQIMNTGESFYIWRKNIGRNVRMTFTKGDGRFICTVKWYNYTSPTMDILTERAQYPNIDVVFSSIGFLIDSDNGVASFYAVNAWNDTQYTSRYQLVRRGYSWGWSGGSYDCARGIFALLFENEPEPTPGGSNPYSGGGLSGPGGGEDQNFDEVSDTIDLPALPIYGATGSGFVTAFCPTVGQINSVADYLITPNVAQVIQGLFVKLSDVIIGLHLLPFVVNATNKKNIEIKNLAFTISTGVESYYADNQYQRLDMGTVDVLKCWDNCLDYNPYTFVSIYLPFCGYFELDTDEVMGKTLHVVYDVDIITGSCVALIQVDGSVMYQFSGMCSCQIPITSVDFNQAVQSLIGLGASAAAGIKMIKGAAAATQEAASVAMAPTTKNSVRQAAYENYMEAKMNEQEIKESVASRLANASVNAVISGKGNYMHAGAVSSAPGFLACRKPFLIIKRPKQSVPEDYESMRGFPSNMKATLGDLSGYTEVEDIHLNIPDATVDEIVECERLLKGGVYL